MAYYTLVTRDHAGAKWFPQFGDYDREAVEFEQDDYVHGSAGIKKINTKIVKTKTVRRSDVDAAIAKLNCETVDAISTGGHGLSWRAA